MGFIGDTVFVAAGEQVQGDIKIGSGGVPSGKAIRRLRLGGACRGPLRLRGGGDVEGVVHTQPEMRETRFHVSEWPVGPVRHHGAAYREGVRGQDGHPHADAGVLRHRPHPGNGKERLASSPIVRRPDRPRFRRRQGYRSRPSLLHMRALRLSLREPPASRRPRVIFASLEGSLR